MGRPLDRTALPNPGEAEKASAETPRSRRTNRHITLTTITNRTGSRIRLKRHAQNPAMDGRKGRHWLMTQTYSNQLAIQWMREGFCPACGNAAENHSNVAEFWLRDPLKCRLLPQGV